MLSVTPYTCGEKPDITILYSDCFPRLVHYFGGRIGHRAFPNPEDMAQEVFLRALTHYPDFTGNGQQAEAWLYTIARHLIIDTVEREKRRPMAPADVLDTLPCTGDEYERTESEIDAQLALSAVKGVLSPRQFDVISLTAEEFTPNEISKMTGCNGGAVRQALF
ncbi:MAG: RNA polymerase sigma factor, partial [Candidatus Aenigmarchaeota archaeon]|nr:RNA polymerase sigma factor [Candidatus Aenigmarchaeota archaeon]